MNNYSSLIMGGIFGLIVFVGTLIYMRIKEKRNAH
jgi:hypothetical protein